MSNIIIPFLIAAAGAVIVWLLLYGLFVAKSQQQFVISTPKEKEVICGSLVTKASSAQMIALTFIAVMIFLFLILPAHNLYSKLTTQWFQSSASGHISLALTPLKVPKTFENNPGEYCKQFVTEEGLPTNIYSLGKHGIYCGYFGELKDDSEYTISYKLLPNDKAQYWISSEMQVTGLAPHHNSKVN